MRNEEDTLYCAVPERRKVLDHVFTHLRSFSETAFSIWFGSGRHVACIQMKERKETRQHTSRPKHNDCNLGICIFRFSVNQKENQLRGEGLVSLSILVF